jgi:BirA family biotin operon repressor/biotin-[acetyl-CoA-carboxylase] ligase
VYEPILKTRFIGKNLNCLPSCHSTNDIAAYKVRSGESQHGEVVITEEQTAGKGQHGNRWFSEAGKNLLFSVILKPENLSVSEQFVLSKCVALGIQKYVASKTKEPVAVKWPNDILIGERKVAGVLIENSIRGRFITASVVGIGLNMNQRLFANERSTSLSLVTNQTYDLRHELEELLWCLEEMYTLLSRGVRTQLDELYLIVLFGYRKVREFVDSNGISFVGEITGVSSDGRLKIATDSGERTYGLKEVSWVW